MFTERLITYRESLGLIKREFAERLEVSESYYNMIENGKRDASQNFIDKLVNISHKPEEYWIYGIDTEEYIDSRNDFKSMKKAMEQLIELKMVNNTDDINSLFNDKIQQGTIEDLIIKAFKSDFEYILNKTNK